MGEKACLGHDGLTTCSCLYFSGRGACWLRVATLGLSQLLIMYHEVLITSHTTVQSRLRAHGITDIEGIMCLVMPPMSCLPL